MIPFIKKNSFRPSKSLSKQVNGSDALLARISFGSRQRANTYERLAAILENVNAVEAIEALYEVASEGGRKRGEGRAIMFANVLFTLKRGRKLADGFRPFVPISEYRLLMAGEESGDLPAMFRHAARTARAKAEMIGAVAGTTAYPILLLIAAFLYFTYL